MVHAEYRASAEGESIEFVPEHEYPGQWFDDMGSLMMLAGEGGAGGWDVSNTPFNRQDRRNLGRMLMQSEIPAYE